MASYRAVLEVLKWLPAKDATDQLTLISQCWKKACESQELWQQLTYQLQFDIRELGMNWETWKSAFRDLLRTARNRLVVVSASFILLFDCLHLTSRMHKMPIQPIDEHSAAVLISPQELFVCGGSNNPHRAFTFHLVSLTTTVKPDLKTSRINHAITCLEGVVYIFGGFLSKPIHRAEKFGLTHNEWTRLPKMIAGRTSLNICSHTIFIYLCGGYSKTCEMFNTQSESYTLLPLKLEDSDWTLAIIYEGKLVVISRDTFYFVGRNSTRIEKGKLSDGPYLSCRSGNMPPVVVGEKIYVTLFEPSKVIEIDMKTLIGIDWPLTYT